MKPFSSNADSSDRGAAAGESRETLLAYEMGDIERDLYEQWKKDGRHWQEYASELAGTAFLLFCVVAAVAAFEAKSSPVAAAIPSPGLRLFAIGLLLGGAGWLVALTGPGRLSGAHINPAISIGFLVLGKMYARDTVGYVAAQMAGAIAGAWLGALALGSWAKEVRDAVLYPGPAVSWSMAFAAEAATTFVLCFAIYTFVSHKRLARWTPAMATLAVGILVWLDGAYSGCGMNPARWFGPALMTCYWRYLAVYTLGPAAGAILAALVRRSGLVPQPVPHTGKVYHDPRYRSVFRQDTLASRPPRHAEGAESSSSDQ